MPLLNADQTPLNLIRWNKTYSEEMDIAQNFCALTQELVNSLSLTGELQQGLKESDDTEGTKELLEMAKEDTENILTKIIGMESSIGTLMQKRLNLSDILGSSTRTWTLEVTGRAGGIEASLFAGDLMEMYRNYMSEVRGWQIHSSQRLATSEEEGEDSSASVSETAPKRLVATGDLVYLYLRHEIGVHKVQRVPVTDAAGKMQTSTAVVTLIPDLDPVTVDVFESDCSFEFVRGSGPGGQGMQSSSNACCVTHHPSGISLKCHQSRSARGNKEIALKMIAQELLNRKIAAQKSEHEASMAVQHSSGERSDKMRTYNWPQNRVTDHRLGKDFTLTSFMEGTKDLTNLHEELNLLDRWSSLTKILLEHIEKDFAC